ncbi:NYN domain-containing protein [Geobacillus sp. PK12]|uniref:NYN domain-containing protein n=1 Tax=Geobacillus sp. PK12 TaxID=2508525 RepID=UPI0010130E35|nr:NYN domain-containing protein [Geobacillus sp. PK12]RXS87031.1 NYN domain-containing protein [Geobacillus sp. PK12]
MCKVHIFWDNSNIHIVGRNHVMKEFEPEEDQKLFRSYFKNLFLLAHRNRPIGSAYVVGSIPPPNSNLWDHVRRLGVTLELLERSASNKEVGVDQTLQVSMFREAVKNDGHDHTFVVLTGDGAGKKLGQGFLNDLELIKKKGFNVEVISWEHGTHKDLKGFAETNGLFIPLEDFYYNVTFIKGKRRADENLDFSKITKLTVDEQNQ